MPNDWVEYHSAIQFVAGANLAFFALPGLREPAFETERRRLDEQMRSIGLDHPRVGQVLELRQRFSQARRRMSRHYDTTRWGCLTVSGFTTLALLFATARATHPAEPLLAWFILLVGLAPALPLVGLNIASAQLLRGIKDVRLQLEKDLSPPGARV